MPEAAHKALRPIALFEAFKGAVVLILGYGMLSFLGRDTEQFAERLGLPCIAQAMKPLPWGVRAAVKKLESQPSQTAIVGDQIFADVMAGRLAGVG